ncbi:hypothetical protein B0H14DRAFT_3504276 [Mycena olivaceomarginata]|nr:hypothetical protein B0H14DRAFT_3504276 [Mycena olivaceomarginata]
MTAAPWRQGATLAALAAISLCPSGAPLLYPRYDPAAIPVPGDIFSGVFPQRSKWIEYAILNNTNFNFTEYGLKDAILMDKINLGGVATFDCHMSAFRDRSGNFITFHGRNDPASNSKRIYDLISRMPSLDTLYCRQFQRTSNVVNTSSHNILLALVDWVEGGHHYRDGGQ